MWNGHFLKAQACLDNFKQVREYFVFFSLVFSGYLPRYVCFLSFWLLIVEGCLGSLRKGRQASRLPVWSDSKSRENWCFFEIAQRCLLCILFVMQITRKWLLAFLMQRKHSAWNWNLRRFLRSTIAESMQQPTYRYPPPLSPDLHSIWKNVLPCRMPFRTSRIAWLVFCMFWLGFVYPRSHSGWIGPIGEIGEAVFEQ